VRDRRATAHRPLLPPSDTQPNSQPLPAPKLRLGAAHYTTQTRRVAPVAVTKVGHFPA